MFAEAVLQSLEALDHTFMTSDSISFYSGLTQTIDTLQTEYDRICKYIFAKDYGKTAASIDEIFKKMSAAPAGYTKPFILTYMQSVIIALIITHCGINYQRITRKIQESDSALAGINDFHSLKCYMQNLIDSYARNSLEGDYSYHIDKAVKYIDKNYAQTLTLQDLSDYTGLSAEYFSRLFRKDTGMTFTQYLNQLRMQHAMFLLSTTKYKLPQIVEECGFHNINHFCIQFKQITGKTPGNYRRDSFVD